MLSLTITFRHCTPSDLAPSSTCSIGKIVAGFNVKLEEPKKKNKRGGRAARMVKQLLHPVYPGQGHAASQDEDEASEGEDVLPSVGAEEDDPSPAAIDPDPDPKGPDLLSNERQGQAHDPPAKRLGRLRSRPLWWEPCYVANKALSSADSWDSVQEAMDHGTLDPIAFVASKM
jgi:hypothetical protein